jgi:hypothetical protein
MRYEDVQYMWLQDQKEKSQENRKEESQEENEIIHPRIFLAGTQVPQFVSSINHVGRALAY